MKPEGTENLPSQFGRYTLVEKLATGGMAEVFKAKILSTHGFEKLLVIKRILPHLAADKTFVSMFIDEAKLTAQLTHPKIVQVTDFGDVNGQYFIALEFVDGFDALALLRTSAQRQLALPMPISMFIVMEVLDALDYAHNAKDIDGKPMRLVHRDISPSNVFIARRGDVKLGDFGIAHAQERESKTQAGTLKGKYGYMSPEQVVGAELDGRSDLFAVGIVLGEMLMGRRLFTAPNDLDVLLMVRDGRLERLDKYGKDIPPELNKIVRKSLEKRVIERYQSAAEFRDALGDLLFKAGFRVGPPDVGRLASDFFDPSPEAGARVVELCRKWDLRQPAGGAAASVRPVPKTEHDESPSTAAVAVTAAALATTREPLPAGLVPAATRAAPTELTPVPTINIEADEDEPLDLHIEEDVSGSAALNDRLSRPLSVVDLDEYSAPGPGAAAPPPPAAAAALLPGQRPDSTGELAKQSPMRIFAELAVAGETGLLRFESATHQKEVFLVKGAPESINSNLSSDRFGEYLVARGFIKAPDLQKALAQLPRFSGKLGDTLVGLGLMRPLDVFRLLSQQVRERVMEIFVWTEGRYYFFKGARNPSGAFPLGLDSFEILGAGVLAMPHDFFERRFVPYFDRRPRVVPRPRINPDAFRLGPTPREVCALLDGKHTLREWMGRFRTPPDKLVTFLRTLYLLVEAGSVQLG